VQPSVAGCNLSNIEIKNIKAKFVDKCSSRECWELKGIATLVNHCTTSVGVHVKLMAYDNEGIPIDTTEFWPASIRNIPSGSYTFKLPQFIDYDPDIKRFEIKAIEVKKWK